MICRQVVILIFLTALSGCKSEDQTSLITKDLLTELHKREINVDNLNIDIIDTSYLSAIDFEKIRLANLRNLRDNKIKRIEVRNKLLELLKLQEKKSISKGETILGDSINTRIKELSFQVESEKIEIKNVKSNILEILGQANFNEIDSLIQLKFNLYGEVYNQSINDTFQIIFSADYKVYSKKHLDLFVEQIRIEANDK